MVSSSIRGGRKGKKCVIYADWLFPHVDAKKEKNEMRGNENMSSSRCFFGQQDFLKNQKNTLFSHNVL